MTASMADGCQYNYVVTAHKPSAVLASVVGRFVKPDGLDLIVSKGTRLEILSLTPSGLESVAELPIYGRVCAMRLLWVWGESTQRLVVVTARQQYAVLAYRDGTVTTLAHGSAEERVGRPAVAGPLAAIDPQGRCLALHLYDAMLRIVPLGHASGALGESFLVKLDELHVLGMEFLDPLPTGVRDPRDSEHTRGRGCLERGAEHESDAGASADPLHFSPPCPACSAAQFPNLSTQPPPGTALAAPQLALLYQDAKGARHVRTCAVNLRDRSLAPGDWEHSLGAAGCSLILPVARDGGAVLLGEAGAAYVGPRGSRALPLARAPVRTACPVDAVRGRWLLGDEQGELLFLALARSGRREETGKTEVGEEGVRARRTGGPGANGSSPMHVQGLVVERLGRTSPASALAYLDDGVVFVGSAVADSQVVRLLTEAGDAGEEDVGEEEKGKGGEEGKGIRGSRAPLPLSFLQVLDSMPNLGPVLDLAVLDSDHGVPGSVVAASGVGAAGSLRIVRNGVALADVAALELEGLKGLWSLKSRADDPHESALVLSFVAETRVLGVAGGQAGDVEMEGGEADAGGAHAPALELEELEGGGGLLLSEPTLLALTVAPNLWVQVTRSGVRCSHAGMKRGTWTPPQPLQGGPAGVHVASGQVNGTVLVVSGGSRLTRLHVWEDGHVSEEASVELEAEVACLDVTDVTWQEGDGMDVDGRTAGEVRPAPPSPSSSGQKRTLAVVGTWARQVCVICPETLRVLAREVLGGSVIPRSVLLAELGARRYVFCGLGDGHVVSWRLGDGAGGVELAERKQLMLGTQPVSLRRVGAENGQEVVFCGLDRPTLVHVSGSKLIYSSLNDLDVRELCRFGSPAVPGALAIARAGALSIARMDAIQRLHVRSVPLGEQPRRLARQDESKTLLALVSAPPRSADEPERDALRLFADGTYETLDRLALVEDEMGLSVLSLGLDREGAEEGGANAAAFRDRGPHTAARSVFVVGTAHAPATQAEATQGRILVCAVEGGRLKLLHERDTHGAVYSLAPFRGGFVAGINSRVQVFELARGPGGGVECTPTCGHSGAVMALYLDARGDAVLLGDLMKSVKLLEYRTEGKPRLEERARDFHPTWMTAVKMLDDEYYLGAENSHNFFVVRKNSEAALDEDRSRLAVVGRFHTGEFVNVIRRGSLVMRLPDSELSNVPLWLFAGVGGSLCVMASLPRALFETLERLQQALTSEVRGLGGLQHAEWRAFSNQHTPSAPAARFVDGDLVEQFLDLSPEAQKRVLAHMPQPAPSLEDLARLVEDLSRLH